MKLMKAQLMSTQQEAETLSAQLRENGEPNTKSVKCSGLMEPVEVTSETKRRASLSVHLLQRPCSPKHSCHRQSRSNTNTVGRCCEVGDADQDAFDISKTKSVQPLEDPVDGPDEDETSTSGPRPVERQVSNQQTHTTASTSNSHCGGLCSLNSHRS